ncbi:tail assembly protein [Paenalcaligenes niemegkensis]|uniref:tail assembly protein n=1 Tax=Paenalcaligenes niemegkensis TaxID=2895469 RepID=UPI001EE8DB4E|nr:tail assembly protein [Paenalcaligenes niemegkensis]MCQ9618407.1 tail assembly protein [Paenalcaligenes niemegkensis]
MALKTVRLYGVLRQFGRDFTLDVNSRADAIQALCCMVPGFEKFLRNAESIGLTFAVFEGKRNLSEDDLVMSGGDVDEMIRIAPIIRGSKSSGLFQTILGVALIAVGYFTFGTTSAVGLGLMAAGAGVGVGGMVQMLSPQPKMGEINERDGNKPGSGFGGAVTTTAQGQPWPVLYGRREVGGAILSGGIYTEDQM